MTKDLRLVFCVIHIEGRYRLDDHVSVMVVTGTTDTSITLVYKTVAIRTWNFAVTISRHFFAGLAFVVAVAGSAQTLAPGAPTESRPTDPATEEPRSAADWLRRADDLTNIRMPGSPAFHMNVKFIAYPGTDFTEPGKSPIMTGKGTYEEWWLAPNKWRREVTLGSYHAVEVLDGVRKFQATSDYEPSRVLMLLRALLFPVPRYLVEPDLQEKADDPRLDRKLTWKVKHLTAGKLSYVELAYRMEDSYGNVDMMTYDLLPSGMPVRLTDRTGLTTGWEKQTDAGGKAVPGHLVIQALGRDLVTADIVISSAPYPANLLSLPGDKAEACMTLRPFDQWELPIWPAISLRTPKTPNDPLPLFPPGVEVVAIAVVDRRGIPREPEASGIQQETPWLREDQKQAVMLQARYLVEAWRDGRFHPAVLDGSPCQVIGDLVFTSIRPHFY